MITLPDLKSKIALFWHNRSDRTKLIILIIIGLVLYIL